MNDRTLRRTGLKTNKFSNNFVLVRSNGLNFCLPRCCHRVAWREGLHYIISELGAGNIILLLGKTTHILVAN